MNQPLFWMLRAQVSGLPTCENPLLHQTSLMADLCACWKIGPTTFRESAFVTQVDEKSPPDYGRSLTSFAKLAFSLSNNFCIFVLLSRLPRNFSTKPC